MEIVLKKIFKLNFGPEFATLINDLFLNKVHIVRIKK